MLAAPFALKNICTGFASALQAWSSNVDKVTAFAEPEKLIPRSTVAYWDPDGVHFSALGSRALGHALAPSIAEILQRLGHHPLPSQRTPAPAEASAMAARAPQVPPTTLAPVSAPRPCAIVARPAPKATCFYAAPMAHR